MVGNSRPKDLSREKETRLNSKELADLVVDALDDMKGQDIRCINVEELTSITDYMVIVTGTSNTHLKALADSASKKVKEAGHAIAGVEGKLASEWVLVDMGGVVVHIMVAPVRALYNLEELWSFKSAQAVAAKESSPEGGEASS
jgi:ribosome-associated protein